jgi:hypothetical protein
MLASLDAQENFAGLARYVLLPELLLGYLYYFAIEPDRRSQVDELTWVEYVDAGAVAKTCIFII